MRYNDVDFPLVYSNPGPIHRGYEDENQSVVRFFSSFIVLAHKVDVAAQVISERKLDRHDAILERKSKKLGVRLVKLPAYVADANWQRFA